MYNQEVKSDYIEQIDDKYRKKITDRIFRFSEELERLKGKDLCDFNEEEFLELFRAYASGSIDALNTYSSFLRHYVQWSCDNNINRDNINHLDYISTSDLKGCLNNFIYQDKYVSYDTLMDLVNKITNPCDKSLVLGLFYGIHGKDCREFYNIKEEDIDKVNEKITLISGRTIYLPANVCEIFINSCNTYEYTSISPNARIKSYDLDTMDKRIFKKRMSSKVETSDDKERVRINKRIIKLRNEFDCTGLSIPRLLNAGMLHFMKIAIEEGKATKEDIYSSQIMEDIKSQYNCHDDCYGLKAKFKDYI